MNEDQYKKLKRESEEAKADSDRADGALEELISRLEKDFGCSNVKEGIQTLKELEQKRDKAETALNKLVEEYEEKWKE